VASRIKDDYESQLQDLEGDKLSLIQRLNESLLHLDKLNQEKNQLSNKLIEQIKFVRDLQRETGKAEDLNDVVNENMKEDLRKEKEIGQKLREELRFVD